MFELRGEELKYANEFVLNH